MIRKLIFDYITSKYLNNNKFIKNWFDKNNTIVIVDTNHKTSYLDYSNIKLNDCKLFKIKLIELLTRVKVEKELK